MNPSLIFDLDGTLVDTAPDLLAALNKILAREGRRAVNIEEMRYLVGHGAHAMLAEAFRLTGPAMPDDALFPLFDDYIALYRAHIADASRPFPGVEVTLAELAKGGAKLGVLTNKPHALAVQLLAALDLTKYFAAVHGAGKYDYTKPDARVFHHVVEELGGTDGKALMVGDSATDVATARAADVPVIVLSYGYTPVPAHLLGGDALTGDFTDIPKLVRELLG